MVQGCLTRVNSFLSFLSQSIHLLEEDESLYCISAWNDQVGQGRMVGQGHLCPVLFPCQTGAQVPRLKQDVCTHCHPKWICLPSHGLFRSAPAKHPFYPCLMLPSACSLLAMMRNSMEHDASLFLVEDGCIQGAEHSP